MSKIFHYLFLIAIAASVIINVIHLFSQSIRLDESQSIWVATKSVAAILHISAQDVQTPLYPVLLHFWMQLFGAEIVMARLLSLVFFVLTLPVLYVLIREVSNKETAFLGVILFSLSPFLIWYSNEARTYTLLSFLTTANHVFFLRLYQSRGQKSKFLYFLFSILGLYTHYFFGFILLTQFLFVAFKVARRKIKMHFSLTFMLVFSFIVLTFLPWLYYVYKLGLAANTQPLIPAPTSFSLIQVYLNFVLGFQNQLVQSLTVSLWPLFLMILFFIFTRKLRLSLLRIDYFLAVSFLPVLLVFLVSFYKPIFLSRYLVIVVPSLFTVFAWLLMNFGKRILSSVSIALLLLMIMSLNFQNSIQSNPVKEDYRQVVDILSAQVTPRDVVAVTAPFTVYPIEYYYKGLARIDTIPQWNRFTQGPIPPFSREDFERQLTEYQDIYYRLYLVLSYDQGYQNDLVDYLDHHYHLVSKNSYPANVELRVYQLRYD